VRQMSRLRMICFTTAVTVNLRGSRAHRANIGAAAPERVVAARRQRGAARAPPRMAVPVGTEERDVLLGELAFTEPDLLPALVESRVARLDTDFYAFVDAKVAASSDLEERETLRMLMEAVKDLQAQVTGGASFGSKTTGPTVDVAAAAPAAMDDKAVADASYDALLDRLVRACREDGDAIGDALSTTVAVSYDDMDKRFLDRLEEASGEEAEDLWKPLTLIKAAIAVEMGKRMTAAAEKLKVVLTAGSPDDMRKELEILAVKGGVDDAFVLLVQGNIQQAENAGVNSAVQVLSSVLEHAAMLKDARLAPEFRLIRRLLRTNDSEARIGMLTEALTPKKAVFLPDGSKTAGVRVNGKRFVDALRDLIEKYGNIEAEFVQKLSEIGEESEGVARKLFDMEDKDVQDLQQEAFSKRSVSVWDLEKVEMTEAMEGRKAAWEGQLGAIPQGFDEHGKLQI
jgi:hypothetical protein